MIAILDLQRLPVADANDSEAEPGTSNVSIHCSGVQNSTVSEYCTALDQG